MTVENQDPGGAPQDPPVVDPEEDTEVSDLKAEIERMKAHNRTVLGEKKKVDSRLRDAEVKLEELNLSKEQEDGNKDEVIDKLKNKIQELESSSSTKDKKYALATVERQVMDAAVKAGCKYPGKALKLIDLGTINVDDDFKVDGDSMKEAIDGLIKDIPDIFSKKGPDPADGTPRVPPGPASYADKLKGAKNQKELNKVLNAKYGDGNF